MSSPIDNTFNFYTDKDTFKKIADFLVIKDPTYHNEDVINFNGILPAPEDLKGEELSDWQFANWGCYVRGFVFDVDIEAQRISFQTNHHAASLIPVALSRMFPDVKIEFLCEEPRWDAEDGGEHWYDVEDVYLNGELLSHKQERIDEDWDDEDDYDQEIEENE